MSFLSFDYGRLFSIFCMNLDQFTCCRNVPSVRNVFWGKNKTALGLSGRNLKTSPVKKSRSKTVHLVVNTCVSMTNPRKCLWLVIIGAQKSGDRYVIQNIGIFRLLDNWTEWSSIQGTILGAGRLWKYVLQTTRFLRNKKLVPERGLHIPHRILKSELFPLPIDKNSKQNI